MVCAMTKAMIGNKIVECGSDYIVYSPTKGILSKCKTEEDAFVKRNEYADKCLNAGKKSDARIYYGIGGEWATWEFD